MKVLQLLHDIQQKLNVPKKRWNKFGEYFYRNQEDILEAVKPLLPDAAVVIVSDEIVALGHGEYARFYVDATATLRCGDEEISAKAQARETFDKKKMDAPQLTGTASSYARKYALNGLFGLDDVKDPDATNTHGKEKKPSPQKAEPDFDPFPRLVKETGMKEVDIKARLKELGLDTVNKIKAATCEKIVKLLKGE